MKRRKIFQTQPFDSELLWLLILFKCYGKWSWSLRIHFKENQLFDILFKGFPFSQLIWFDNCHFYTKRITTQLWINQSRNQTTINNSLTLYLCMCRLSTMLSWLAGVHWATGVHFDCVFNLLKTQTVKRSVMSKSEGKGFGKNKIANESIQIKSLHVHSN